MNMLRSDMKLQAVPEAESRLLDNEPGAAPGAGGQASKLMRRAGLEKVLNNPAIWRATQVAGGLEGRQGLATGWPALDQALPDSGWPASALTELLVSATGAGELSLVMPALRTISAEGKGIALLGTPYLPQARAWEAAGIALERLLIVDANGTDLLWAAEQILRSGECGAVLVWSQHAGRALNHRALQRLHLAAGTGNALCFLYRSVAAETSPSPAPLRLRLAAQAGGLHLHVVKCRGIGRAKPIVVQPFPAHWNAHVAAVAAVAPIAPSSVRVEAQESSRVETSECSEAPASSLVEIAAAPEATRPVPVQLSLV
jgi:cell division inhibitor SulA